MTVPTQQAWLNAIYDAIYAKHEDYYEDSVTPLCLLVITGNYWDPTTIELPTNRNVFLPVILR